MGLSPVFQKFLNSEESYPEHVIAGESLSSLMGLHRPEVNLGILKRDLPYGLKGVFQRLWGREQPLTLRSNVKGDFEKNYQAAFAFLLESDSKDSRWLFEDIFSLALRFSILSRASYLDIQLEIVSTNQCKKFHVDNTGLRLISTYVGPSTHWIENELIDRSRIGDDCYDAELKASVAVRQMKTGEVAILKGDAYPENRGNGLVHKSPEIESMQVRRLVLRIDTYLGENQK